jgi:hypothetical protein
MQNVLDDLLRPAPPIATTIKRRRPGAVQISVRRHRDPRVIAAIVYSGSRLVCVTRRFACIDRRAGAGGRRYRIVLRDRWGISKP